MNHVPNFNNDYFGRPFDFRAGRGFGYSGSQGYQTTVAEVETPFGYINMVNRGPVNKTFMNLQNITADLYGFAGLLGAARDVVRALGGDDESQQEPPMPPRDYYQGANRNSIYDGGRPQYRGDAYQRGSYPRQGDNSNGVFSLGNYLNALDASTGQIPWFSMTAQPWQSMPEQQPWFGRYTAGNGQQGPQVSAPQKDGNGQFIFTGTATKGGQRIDSVYQVLDDSPSPTSETVEVERKTYKQPGTPGPEYVVSRRSAILGTDFHNGEVVTIKNGYAHKVYTDGDYTVDEYVNKDGFLVTTKTDKDKKSTTTTGAKVDPGKNTWVEIDGDGKPVGSGSASTTEAKTADKTADKTATPAPLTDEQKKETVKNAASIGVKVNSFDELKPALVKKAKEKKIDNAENMSEQQLLDAINKNPHPKSNTNPPAPTDDENDVARLVKLQIQYDNKKANHENTEDLAKQLGELKNKLGVLQSDKGNDHLGKVTDPKYAKLVEIAKLQGLYDRVTHIDPKKDQGTYNYWNNAPVTGPDGKVISGLSHKQDLAKKLGYLKSQAAGTVDEKLNAAPKAKAPDSTQPAATDKSPDPTQPAAGTAQTPVPQSPIESGRLPINNAIQMVDTALSQKAAEVRNIENQIAQLAKKPASEFDKPSESSFRGPKNMQGYSPDVVATLTGLLSQRKAIQKELGVLSRRKNAIVNYRDTEHRPDVTANLKDFDGLGYDHSYHSK